MTADELGTPRAVSDGTGNILWAWPLGQNAWGEQQPISTGYTYNLRFPGQYYDAETGLHNNLNRDYDNTIGKYTEVDPIGQAGGIGVYLYALDNPLMYADPLGLQVIPVPEFRPVPVPIPDFPAPKHVYPNLDPVALCLAAGPTCIVPAAKAAMGAENIWPLSKPMANTCPAGASEGDKPDCKAVAQQCIEECRHLIGVDGRLGQSSSFLKCKAECMTSRGCNSL